MKFNKWTVGLAAAGIVTLPSLVRANDDQPHMVQTVTENVMLTGYVDVSAQWNPESGDLYPPYSFGGSSKADGFNMNVVDIALEKPLDESAWSAGYKVELWFGPDANALGTTSTGNFAEFGSGGSVSYYNASTTSDFAIRQAYVTLRTPIGNGIDWKIGVFDTIIGYESLSSPNNPNYSHSYGFTIEPTTHTGILGSYKVCDSVSVSAGIANTFGPQINSRAQNGSYGGVGALFGLSGTGGLGAGIPGENKKSQGNKTGMASVSLTAPESWGWLAGSSMTAGTIFGYNNNVLGTGAGYNQVSYYVGATIATPVTGLKAGFSYDYLGLAHQDGLGSSLYVNAVALYASYQANEKWSFHGRAEEIWGGSSGFGNALYAVTVDAQYDLWKNVITRAEFRWDHAEHGDLFGNSADAYLIAVNAIYRF